MRRDPVFRVLTCDELSELARVLSFNPAIRTTPAWLFLQDVPIEEQKRWLEANPDSIEREICRLGSWSFGEKKSYEEVVSDVARNAGVGTAFSPVEVVEERLIRKLWSDAVDKMTPMQRAEMETRIDEFARRHGKSVSKEFAGFAVLGAAQLSGFGIYMLGSTLLAGLNGALGLGLGFSAFTGLSSLIATAIGPLGWTALGAFTIVKLGSPNHKKVLPAIVYIASKRAGQKLTD